jgi:hypothetical protein
LKISFPKYGPGELFNKERATRCIVALVIIGFLAILCGSYVLQNKFWLLTILLVGIGGILLCLGAAVIFLNSSKVDAALSLNRAPSGNLEEDVPRITSQWDYRPKKPIRSRPGCDSPSRETSEGLRPQGFGIDNVWSNDNSLEGAPPSFINGRPDSEELMTKVLSETTDPVYTTAASITRPFRGTTKVLSTIDRPH